MFYLLRIIVVQSKDVVDCTISRKETIELMDCPGHVTFIGLFVIVNVIQKLLLTFANLSLRLSLIKNNKSNKVLLFVGLTDCCCLELENKHFEQ